MYKINIQLNHHCKHEPKQKKYQNTFNKSFFHFFSSIMTPSTCIVRLTIRISLSSHLKTHSTSTFTLLYIIILKKHVTNKGVWPSFCIYDNELLFNDLINYIVMMLPDQSDLGEHCHVQYCNSLLDLCAIFILYRLFPCDIIFRCEMDKEFITVFFRICRFFM